MLTNKAQGLLTDKDSPMAGFGRGQQWRSVCSDEEQASFEEQTMTLASPVLVTPCGTTCFTIKACIACPICSTRTHLVMVSMNNEGSLFAYSHRSSDGAPNACARRFSETLSTMDCRALTIRYHDYRSPRFSCTISLYIAATTYTLHAQNI